MTQTVETPVEQAPAAAPEILRPRRLTGGRALHLYTWLVIAWLVLPVLVMIAFGFNDTPGRYNQTWEGFTVKWYGRVFDLDELTRALVISVLVALVTMLVAGALGTGIGYALGRCDGVVDRRGHRVATFMTSSVPSARA